MAVGGAPPFEEPNRCGVVGAEKRVTQILTLREGGGVSFTMDGTNPYPNPYEIYRWVQRNTLVCFFNHFTPASDVTRGHSSVYFVWVRVIGLGLGLVPSIVKNTIM